MSKKRTVALALPLTAFTVFALGSPSIALADPVPVSKYNPGMYIVQLTDKPLAAYDGDVAGLASTKPAEGQKLDPRSPQSAAYLRHLGKRRAEVAKSVGATQEVTYSTVFNGFAAELTSTQAAKLAKAAGVAKIHKHEMLTLDTYSTPEFLGLTGKEGIWAKRFGSQGKAGEGVIVGMIDSGFVPENPSFASLSEPRPDAADIKAQWKGGQVVGNIDNRDGSVVCDPGEDDTSKAAPVTCNNKVLGARWYKTGIKDYQPEFSSPRDYGGHGSHTASTAAGNANVDGYSIAADGTTRLPYGKLSGMAPAARLAIYKVCWTTSDKGDNSCSSIDSVKAIDQAVYDGVDVINYSISGSRDSVVDPVEIAFLNAAQAGVFIAASAGNSGDTTGVSSVAHNSPWVTTVAASTHDRAFRKKVILGNGATYVGNGVGAALPKTSLVEAVKSGLPNTPMNHAELCYDGVLDPAKVAGKIVVCKRGVNDRLEKSRAVKNAGGIGMVLYNPTASTLTADQHYVPTVHVDEVAGAAIKEYLEDPREATAALSATERIAARSPEMAGFSSYGPALAGSGDLLKPDITAPGVDIVAAVAPQGNKGQDFASYQGTSMSSPHIAGIAALIKSAHADWSPMAIKSAIMTTASQKDNAGKPIQARGMDATPLNFGAGHVVPAKAFDPGLVYESNLDNWLSYICALGQDAVNPNFPIECADFPKIAPSDLNTPSIAIGGLGGTQTVTRTVKNITNKTGVYTAKVEAPAGTEVAVSPSRLAIAPGKSATFTVKIAWSGAKFDNYAFGALTWWDGQGHEVRSPIAVRPLGLVVPSELSARTGTEGGADITAKAGFNGTLTTTALGLAASSVTEMPLHAGGAIFNPEDPEVSGSVGKFEITVPEGTEFLRFATFDADYTQGTDLDLYVYKKEDNELIQVGSSAGPTAEESVTLKGAGTYVVFVDLYGAPDTMPNVTVKLHTWTVGTGTGASVVNLTVPDPQNVVAGTSYTIPITWHGLEAGKRYLGAVRFGDGKGVIAETIVRVNP